MAGVIRKMALFSLTVGCIITLDEIIEQALNLWES